MGYRINVKNAKYAKILTDTAAGYTIDTPKALPGLMTIDVTMLSASGELYGDGALVSKLAKITGATVKLGLNKIPTAVKADILGANVDDKGILTVTTEDVIPRIAIYCETEQDDGKKEQMWFLAGQAEPIGVSGQQATSSVNYSTEELTVNFIRRLKDKAVYKLIDTSDEGIDSATSTAFETNPD